MNQVQLKAFLDDTFQKVFIRLSYVIECIYNAFIFTWDFLNYYLSQNCFNLLNEWITVKSCELTSYYLSLSITILLFLILTIGTLRLLSYALMSISKFAITGSANLLQAGLLGIAKRVIKSFWFLLTFFPRWIYKILLK